jgi:hypothetical protein
MCSVPNSITKRFQIIEMFLYYTYTLISKMYKLPGILVTSLNNYLNQFHFGYIILYSK